MDIERMPPQVHGVRPYDAVTAIMHTVRLADDDSTMCR